jgi:NAD(P)-dependent dehydrogenase (short-subunit alcohol dehydrogenase family)
MFLCGQAVARRMVEQGIHGRIVNVGSVNSYAAEREAATYVTTKHGVLGLTHAMAVDLAVHGITVNCLAPGPITVERNAEVFSALRTSIAANVPLGRAGTIEETAAAALFLASDEASYITGATLVVDGGMLAYIR